MDNLNSQSEKTITKKKKWFIPVLIASAVIIFAAILAIGFIFVIVAKPKIKVQKQLNLGDKYITEMDYENAVLAYQEAIRIDPKNEAAYRGLANAYINLSDECLQNGDTDGASKYLKRAIKEVKPALDQTDSREIAEIIEEMEEKENDIEDDKGSEEKKDTNNDDQAPDSNNEQDKDKEKVEEKAPVYEDIAVTSLPVGLNDFLADFQWFVNYNDNYNYESKDCNADLVDTFLGPMYQFYNYPVEPFKRWDNELTVFDVENTDWILKNVYNVSDDTIGSLKNGSYPDVECSNGEYKVFVGGIGGNYKVELKSAMYNGTFYYITYQPLFIDFDTGNYYPYGDIRYALLEYKNLDGNHFWSLYRDSSTSFQ